MAKTPDEDGRDCFGIYILILEDWMAVSSESTDRETEIEAFVLVLLCSKLVVLGYDAAIHSFFKDKKVDLL